MGGKGSAGGKGVKPTIAKPTAGSQKAFGGRIGGGLAASVARKLAAPAQAPKFTSKGAAKGATKFQSKGQSKGHSKHAGAKTDNPGFKGERNRILSHRITGKVIKWKGPFGWIVPDTPVKHAGPETHGGKIYLDQIDVEEELSGVGARVSFFVYKDDAGLGAQHVVMAKDQGRPAAQQSSAKSADKGASKGAAKGASKVLKSEGKPGAKPAAKPAKGEGKGKKAKGEGKGKGKEKELPPPDKSTRESLAEFGNGVIVDWRGNVGWLLPDEELTHPDAKQTGRRKGMLFVHSSDCEGDEQPLINAKVMYSMYKDSHGLGAEAVYVLEQGDGEKPTKESAEAE